jgi:hypothetical protein
LGKIIGEIMNKSSPSNEETQKLVKKITRFAGLGFLLAGLIVLMTDGDLILGGTLTIIGITDLVILPDILEKIIHAKMKEKNDRR